MPISDTAQHEHKPADPGYAKISEVCRYLSVSRSTLYQLMSRGDLVFVSLPSGSEHATRRVPWSSVHALLAKGSEPAAAS